MSDFIRPAVRVGLRRWQEVIAAFALMGLGLWFALTGASITMALGAVISLAGLGWALAAIQRVRFAQKSEGPGVVQLRERRLAYFGPLGGGVMDVAALAELAYEPGSFPGATWCLTDQRGQVIVIPIDAAGAEALFDVFAGLPGLQTAQILTLLSDPPARRRVLWRCSCIDSRSPARHP